MNNTPQRFEDYQAERSAVFPTMASLQWFVRTHRDVLIERGALISPTGRKVIVPTIFDSYVGEVGRERALRDSEKNFRGKTAGRDIEQWSAR